MPQKPTIKIQCKHCNTDKLITKAQYERGSSFCSIECSASYRRIHGDKKITKLTCAYCNTDFERNTSKLLNSKSGIYFCCKEHKSSAQRIGGIKEIQPAHYGTSENGHTTTYRRVAFSNLSHKCNKCNYSKYPEILQVHHKDRDRSNNHVSNLEILCPTCHNEEHFLAKDGPFIGPR